MSAANPTQRLLTILTTVEKDRDFEYLSKYFKHHKLEDQNIINNCIKREK